MKATEKTKKKDGVRPNEDAAVDHGLRRRTKPVTTGKGKHVRREESFAEALSPTRHHPKRTVRRRKSVTESLAGLLNETGVGRALWKRLGGDLRHMVDCEVTREADPKGTVTLLVGLDGKTTVYRLYPEPGWYLYGFEEEGPVTPSVGFAR